MWVLLTLFGFGLERSPPNFGDLSGLVWLYVLAHGRRALCAGGHHDTHRRHGRRKLRSAAHAQRAGRGRLGVVVHNPLLLFDASFQLSLTATAAIVWGIPAHFGAAQAAASSRRLGGCRHRGRPAGRDAPVGRHLSPAVRCRLCREARWDCPSLRCWCPSVWPRALPEMCPPCRAPGWGRRPRSLADI